MPNDYYTNSDPPVAATKAKSANESADRDAVEAAFNKLPGEAALKRGNVNYQGTDTGSANAYVISLSNVTSYTEGLRVSFKAANANTGASVINVSTLGNKSILRRDGSALVSGDIGSGEIIDLIYDGTAFRMVWDGVYQDASGALMASAAEAAALTSTTKYLNPLRFIDSADAYLAGRSDLASPAVGDLIPIIDIDDSNAIKTADLQSIVDAASSWTEGTFTPHLEDVSFNTATSTASADYIKIGNWCFFWFRIAMTSKGSMTGSVLVDGMPFTAASGTAAGAGVSGYVTGLNVTAGRGISYEVIGATDLMKIWLDDATTGQTQLQATELATSATLVAAGMYKTV